MANYLVTGGCGFIGSQLTKKLITNGHKVTIVDDLSNGTIIHPDATFIKKDITEPNVLPELFIGIDGCFHLAAVPAVNIEFEQWLRFHDINLNGSLAVFNAAVNAGNIPVVYASSCGVYGGAKRFPLTEGLSLRPPSAYGCDKLSSELNANFLACTYQLPSMGLRFFNVYGPYQQDSSPYSGVITHFIASLLNNKPLTIYGDGQQTRDYIFVEDVVDNLIHAMKILKKGAHVVNLCTGVATTINQLSDLMADLIKKTPIKDYQPPRPNDARDSYGCSKKMDAYGFKLPHDVRQGLIKTIDYFKDLHH